MNYQTFEKNELCNKILSIIEAKVRLKIDIRQLLSCMNDSKSKEYLASNVSKSVCVDELDYSEICSDALKTVGYIDENAIPIGPIFLNYIFENDSVLRAKITQNFISWLQQQNGYKIEPSQFIFDQIKYYGYEAGKIAYDVFHIFFNHLNASPYYLTSKFGSVSTINLAELYQLEKPNSKLGKFFDQRYIDFLNKNNDEIDRIHWAKFEQLTQEFYGRKGYNVIPGKGRKDNGADLLIEGNNQRIIVQCKRQMGNVNVNTVKNMDFDITHNNYDKGILYCTHDVTKDGKELIAQYRLKIEIANRKIIIAELKNESSVY